MFINKINNFINKEILKYGYFNSYDLLKTIAFFTMLIDHLGYYFFYNLNFLRLIGRITIIIYTVLYGTSLKRGKKHSNKILYFAILTSIIQFILLGINEAFPLNTLWCFYFSNFLIDYLEDIYNNVYILFILLIILIAPLSFIGNFFFEYGFGFFMLVFCGRIFSKEIKNKKDIISTVLIFLMFLIYQIINFYFNLKYSIILAIIYIILYKVLYNFKIKTMDKIKNTKNTCIKIINNLCIIISRRSMELYTIHLSLFILILIIIIYKYGYFR